MTAIPRATRLSLGGFDGSTIAFGSLTHNAGGSFTYLPEPAHTGTTTFTYIVADGHGGASTGTVTITVNHVNQPPIAGTDAYSVVSATTLARRRPRPPRQRRRPRRRRAHTRHGAGERAKPRPGDDRQ